MLCGLTALCLAPFAAAAIDDAAHSVYAIAQTDQSVLATGRITPTADGSSVLSGRTHSESLALALLDPAQQIQWTLLLNADDGRISASLQPDPDDSELAFAGAIDDDATARWGLFNGADRSARFAVQANLAALPSKAILSMHHAHRSTLLQDRGAQIELLLLDGEGQTLFDRQYSSPDFLATETVGVSSQSARLSELPDRTGFALSIHKSVKISAGSLGTHFENTFFLIYINNDGSKRWAISFELSTTNLVRDQSTVGPDNSYLYQIANSRIGIPGQPSTRVASCNIIKVTSAGTLAFAKSIDGFEPSATAPIFDASRIYLSGTKPQANAPLSNDLVLASLDKTTGALLGSVGIDQGDQESGELAGARDGQLFGTLTVAGDGEDSPAQTIVFRVDSHLQNSAAMAYARPAEAGFVSLIDGGILFSPYHQRSASIGAFALDSNLEMASSDCAVFSESTLNVFEPALAERSLEPVFATLELTVSETSTTLASTPLPLDAFELLAAPCKPPIVTGRIPIDLQFTDETVALTFATELGKRYDVLRASELDGEFNILATVQGTGQAERFEEPIPTDRRFFYRVVRY